MKRLVGLTVSLAVILVPLFTSPAFAASAGMSLSVSGSSVAKGSYVTVSIRENSGTEPVNGVQANFTYSANLLQYVSISNSASFGIVAQNGAGGGSVAIGRGALPAVSGSQLVASVQFKALTNTGTASFAFSGGSSVVSANSNADIATSKTGASVSLTDPAPVVPKDTTPPTITGIRIANVTAASATITWTTSEPASSEVDYGFTTGYGITAANGTLVTAHTVILNSPLIIAGSTYHYVVKSADGAGNAAAGADSTFTTAGADIVVLVTDQQTNKPLRGVSVSWNNQTVITDNQGKAALVNLPPGIATLVVRAGTTVSFRTIVVAQPTDKPQLVAFKTTLPQASTPLWISGLLTAALVVLVAAISYLIGRGWLHWGRPLIHSKRRPATPASTTNTPMPASTVITPQPPAASPAQATPRPDITRPKVL